MVLDSTQRFSTRVANYVRYRPGYPATILPYLHERCQLNPGFVIADVGSGTGLLSRLFLENGNRVYGIEPNREMREAGETLLQECDRFISVEGTAEATTLPDQSIDLVTAGQAFHWFDPDRAKAEFQRILNPPGWVALIWNARRTDSSFGEASEELIKTFSTDYEIADHRRVDDRILNPFFGGNYTMQSFDNAQSFDYEGLKGRLLSSSYIPEAGHPNYEPMLVALRELFEAHQVDGQIQFEYNTEVFVGSLS